MTSWGPGWPRAAAMVAVLLLSAGAFGQAADAKASSELRGLGAPAAGSVEKGGRGGGSGLPTTIALGGVVGLALAAGGVVRLVAKKRGGFAGSLSAGGRSPAGIMEIIGRYPVGRGCTLVLLKVDRRILLLSQSATGRWGMQANFCTLAEITDPEEVSSILIKSRDADGDSMSERFRSLLGRAERGMEPEVTGGGRRTRQTGAGDRAEVWDDRTGIPVIDLTRNQEAGAAGALRRRLSQISGGGGAAR